MPKSTFTYSPTNQLPKLGAIKTEWDLKKHYYKSETDSQIEKDAVAYETAHRAFIKKYRTANFTKDSSSLLRALQASEALAEDARGAKVIRYFGFRTVLNVNDTAAQRKLAQYSDRFRKLSVDGTFFALAIGAIPKAKQREYLKDERLKKYHYLLRCSFEDAKHQLTEAEEKILKQRNHTSSAMWADATEKILSNRTIKHAGKAIKVPEALEILDTLPWEQKTVLWNSLLDEMVQISEFAEHELTAIATHDKVSDELRGYKRPYSATVRGYENDETAVEALVEAISTKGFALSKKFYKLKAKLHGKDSIPYVNKYDSIGDLPQPDFAQSVTVCRDAFYGLDTRYGEIFDRLLINGQTDVYPRAGKQGGAFMAASVGLPTFVKLNHVNNLKSLETLAHEMGHAIHAELSKEQPVIYEDFSTTTAETASTFFEQLVTSHLLETLPDDQKVILLHDKISRDIATIQRQIAFFNFELAMHEHVRKEGLITKEELAALMQKSLTAYLGPAVEVTERDGYSFVYVPHVRYGFYVYTYTYGHLVSNLMLQKYAADSAYLNKIDGFLRAGSTDTVENIFKAAGINTTKVDTFLESLKTQETEIKLLEKLTKK